MIIAHWHGFEIDSSEGYYGFHSDIKDIEEGWKNLTKFFSSPLLWNKMAFSIGSGEEKNNKEIISHLSNLCQQGDIEETSDKYKYCPHNNACSIPILQDILTRFKEMISYIRINFCIQPLEMLPGEEYLKLKIWFLEQFKDKREGRSQWNNYAKIKETDFFLSGNSDYTDHFINNYAFEGSLHFYLDEQMGLSIFMSAGDPSLIIYLISTIFYQYDLEYYGDHWITVDKRPDKLKDLIK